MQDMPIGERIRLYRRRRGLSQPRLAQLIGRSESWLSQVERGVRSVDRFSTIIELARVLQVQVVELTGRPLSLAPNGGAHFEAVDALRRALMSYSAIPAALDMGGEHGRRPDLTRLRRTVVMANELYQAGSYSGAGELLPGAIADAQEASRELRGDDRQAAFRILAETYHITAKSLTKVSETELAWIAAERALAAAERAEAPLLVGASAYHIGHAFLRAGRNREATDLTMEATTVLGRVSRIVVEFGLGAVDAVEAGRATTIRAQRRGVGAAGAAAASDDAPAGWALARSPPGPQRHLVPGA
jgi:transcriptional regulator with XRE-family HTH domain